MNKIFLLLVMLPFFGISQIQFAQITAGAKDVKLSSPKIVIEESSEELICDFYPNPSTGLIHTWCSSNILSYSLVDENGKTVYSKTPVENNKIRIADVPPGLYIVNIGDIDHRFISKKVTISY